MSRWLSSVGTLLEQLDGRAGTVAEDLAIRQEEVEEPGLLSGGGILGGSNHASATASTSVAIDSILAKRGLSFNGGEEQEVDDYDEEEEENDEHDQVVQDPSQLQQQLPTQVGNGDGDKMNYEANMAGFSDDGFFEDSQNGEMEEVETEEEKGAPANIASDSKTVVIAALEESNGEPSQSSSKEDDPINVVSPDATIPKPEIKDESLGTEEKEGSSQPEQPPVSGSTSSSPEAESGPPEKDESQVEEEAAALSAPAPSKIEAPVQPSGPVVSPRPPPPKAPTGGTPPKLPPTPSTPASSVTYDPNAIPSFLKKELTEARAAQKEARTLRRHVVSLNSQLEAAEAELDAQRVELEQAAKRMADDRRKLKEERESTKTKHSNELLAVQQANKLALQELQTRMEEQVESARQRIREMEQQRMQEGGDWNKELAQAMEREEELRNTLASVEEEKNTYLAQISTMQSQQAALGSRLESLSQTADNAMEREREAEDRLDAALSMHAKQISQRQAREAELERTVQELGAALVVAQNAKSGGQSKSDSSLADDNSPSHDIVVSLKARIESLSQDLETANSNLALERERTQTLHSELREMSKETTQEASAVHARQVQYDRQIADLTLTVSKMEANLRDANKEANDKRKNADSRGSSDGENAKQIKMLSEEVLRLRDKVANYNSETLTLRSRLQASNERAEQAEDELSKALTTPASGDSLDNMERASGMNRRRRGNGPTIRQAMQLNPGQGDRREQIGRAMDAVDSFAASSGKFLRRNPLARAGFILYLLLIHFWTFILLFFHAHSFDHGDFGPVSNGHGPHSLLQQQSPLAAAVANVTGAKSSP